jgi:hypothetical protein
MEIEFGSFFERILKADGNGRAVLINQGELKALRKQYNELSVNLNINDWRKIRTPKYWAETDPLRALNKETELLLYQIQAIREYSKQ